MAELTETDDNSYNEVENKVEETKIEDNDKKYKLSEKDKQIINMDIDNILDKMNFALILYPKLVHSIIILIILVIICFVVIIILSVKTHKYRKNYKKCLDLK